MGHDKNNYTLEQYYNDVRNASVQNFVKSSVLSVLSRVRPGAEEHLQEQGKTELRNWITQQGPREEKLEFGGVKVAEWKIPSSTRAVSEAETLKLLH